MGSDVNNFDSGGGVTEGIGALFQGSSTGGVAFGGIYVGPDPPHGAGPEQISAQGRTKAHHESSEEAGVGGVWYYPPLAVAMAEADFKEIGVYVTRRQNMVAQYIVTLPILDLC